MTTKAEDVSEVEFLELGTPAPDNNNNTQTSSNDTDEDIDKDTNKDTDDNNTDTDDIDTGQDSDNNDTDTDTTDSDNNKDTDTDTNENLDTDDTDDDSDADQQSLFEGLISGSGVEFDEQEKEQLLSLEENEEGLNTVADAIAQKKAESHFSALMEQYPHTSRMLEYEMSGGDPQKYRDAYFPEVDYNEVEISSDDLQTQKQIVAQSLQLQGLEQEDIDSELEDLENAGLLENRANRSLKVLRKKQEEQREQIEQEREQLKEQRQKQAREQYENTVEIIEQGEIEGIKIPENKQDEFKKYLFEPVNEQGHTQAQLDSNELGLEQRVLMAYLNFSGYNLDGFINNQANNSSNKNLRKALDKSNNKENLKKKGDKSKEKPGNPEDIISPFMN